MQDYANLSDKSKELREYRRVYVKKKIREHAFEIRLSYCCNGNSWVLSSQGFHYNMYVLCFYGTFYDDDIFICGAYFNRN